MKIDEMLKAINNIEKRIGFKLSDVQKILLTTDGSVTRILEVLTKKPVVIETKIKTSIKANEGLAKDLKIKSGEIVNYRVVHLKNPDDRALIFARSWTPIMRLSENIKRDLTSADIPIGKILIKHKVETRREITSIETINSDDEMADAFNIKFGGLMLSRYYNIIHEAKILIRINEAFPISSFL
ncbi:MAG: chorismate pyruvate-lyase family protein [Nitrososphaerales archaeon]